VFKHFFHFFDTSTVCVEGSWDEGYDEMECDADRTCAGVQTANVEHLSPLQRATLWEVMETIHDNVQGIKINLSLTSYLIITASMLYSVMSNGPLPTTAFRQC
jgi:hypothetical protein